MWTRHAACGLVLLLSICIASVQEARAGTINIDGVVTTVRTGTAPSPFVPGQLASMVVDLDDGVTGDPANDFEPSTTSTRWR